MMLPIRYSNRPRGDRAMNRSLWIVVLLGLLSSAPAQQIADKEFLKPAESRTFSIEYVGKLQEIPAGTKKLRVWLPVPQDSTVQSIKNVSFSKEATVATEPKYGNKIAYVEIDQP